MKTIRVVLFLAFAAGVVAFTFHGDDYLAAVTSITAEDLLVHIRELSSDRFEGRSPGTGGDTLTVEYITQQFKRLGLKPGNPDGLYIQRVPLVGFTAQNPTANIVAAGKEISTAFPSEIVLVSRRITEEAIEIQNSEIVFVGYGVAAPEYGWDDYKGMDVRGKTLLMLVNDPQVPDQADPSQLDSTMFKGRAMTYYGRWTYKYEIASEKGAAAAIIIHETGPAGYPFEVVSGSWSRENFDITRPDGNRNRVAIESWITREKAAEVIAACGKSLDELKRDALRKDFKPVTLGATANFNLSNTLRNVESNNVLGLLEGSDPNLKKEYIVYTAHWDHLGRDPKLEGDQIYNGAIDNASGVSSILEIAEAFTKMKSAPPRSLLFLAVTAEERGLLGAKYYAANPLYPLAKTVANLNIDGINQWGRTKDIIIVGAGMNTLQDILVDLARKQDRIVLPDAEPQKGFFYRSDQFEFAKEGVPALYTDPGINFIGKPEGYGMKKRDEYTDHDYHSVSDEVKPDWDLSGGVEDVQLMFEVGLRVATASEWPVWNPGTEFKLRREAMLKK